MCLAGQLFSSAPKGVKTAMNLVTPGIGLAAKAENKLYEKTMPDAGKQMIDKITPTSVRQGMLQSNDKGAKNTLYNQNSETEEAANVAKQEEDRLAIQRAFAAKYNNQARLLS